jgi:hypothetical protein
MEQERSSPPDFEITASTRQQYSQTPVPLADALRQRAVSFSAYGLYGLLDSFRDRQTKTARVGYRRLRDDTGLAFDTLAKLVGELEAAGFLRIIHPTDPSQPNTYDLLYAPGPRLPVAVGAQSGRVPATGTRTKPGPDAFQTGPRRVPPTGTIPESESSEASTGTAHAAFGTGSGPTSKWHLDDAWPAFRRVHGRDPVNRDELEAFAAVKTPVPV